MNTLTQAAENLLTLCSPNTSGFDVYSYQNENDFCCLWGIGDYADSGPFLHPSAIAKPNVLLIWDGTPQYRETSGVTIQDFVTPYDWLVAMCLRAAECPTPVPFRIFLWDLASARHPSSFSCRVLPLLLPRMPWVRVYEGIDALLTDVHQSGVVPTVQSDATLKATAALLRQLWTSELTKAETRHSVSNLVAPFVLADGLCEEGWKGAPDLWGKLAGNHLRSALLALLRQLGMVSEPAVRKSPDVIGHSGHPSLFDDAELLSADAFDSFKKVRFLLVDDQCDLGYKDILATTLFGHPETLESDANLLAARRTPACLINALYALCPGINRPLMSARHSPEARVLEELLTFYHRSRACQRLEPEYSALNQAALAARKRLDELLGRSAGPYCGQCGTVLGGELAEPFDWDAPHVLEKAIDEQGEEVEYDILLLDLRLFPSAPSQSEKRDPPLRHHLFLSLLLSYADPSLPIIVFSSTQQRVVAEAFKGRPSIVTHFSKPIVSGYADLASAKKSITNLEDALREALRLHKVRIIWRALEGISQHLPIEVHEPLLEFERPSGASNEYIIDRYALHQLCREYIRLCCRGFNADAIAVPGNVLESMGARLAPSVFSPIKMTARVMEQTRANNPQWDWYEVANSMLGPGDARRKAVGDLVYSGLDNLATEESSNAIHELKKYFGSFRKAGWCEAFTNTHPLRLDEFRKRGGVRSVANKAIGKIVKKKAPFWAEDLEHFAAKQFYTPIQAFRNMRQHYSCRPWRHDDELVDYAVWIWIWVCEGLERFSAGERMVRVSTTVQPDAMDLAIKNEWLPTSSYDPTRAGTDACRQPLLSLGCLVKNGVFKLAPPRQCSLDKFVFGLLVGTGSALPKETELAPPRGISVPVVEPFGSPSDLTLREVPAGVSVGTCSAGDDVFAWPQSATKFVLEGCPSPLSSRVARGDIVADVARAGFTRPPRWEVDQFVLVVDPQVERDALQNARGNGILVCGHRVTLRPAAPS